LSLLKIFRRYCILFPVFNFYFKLFHFWFYWLACYMGSVTELCYVLIEIRSCKSGTRRIRSQKRKRWRCEMCNREITYVNKNHLRTLLFFAFIATLAVEKKLERNQLKIKKSKLKRVKNYLIIKAVAQISNLCVKNHNRQIKTKLK